MAPWHGSQFGLYNVAPKAASPVVVCALASEAINNDSTNKTSADQLKTGSGNRTMNAGIDSAKANCLRENAGRLFMLIHFLSRNLVLHTLRPPSAH